MPAFKPPADLPTQQGADGIRFDFNLGARVLLPPREEGLWRVRLRDLETGSLLFESENKGASVTSTKKWAVRFRIEVRSVDPEGAETLVLAHDFDARDRDVLVQFPVGTLGDTLAWFPAAARFADRHGCRLTCSMAPRIIPLFESAYPGIRFIDPAALDDKTLLTRFYASYALGLFFDDEAFDWQPCDFRQVGLHHSASYILGLETSEEPPHLALPDESRPLDEPYVCIAVQATTYAKTWTNPHGWHEVVRHLKTAGYRVVCIDQQRVTGAGFLWTHIPHGAEDQTGDRPLTERARWLRHAAAFIGLGSGLSWLAWGARCPVVLISGFSHPTSEFATPYRIINWHTCNSCWNDVRHRFDHKDHLWCPRQAGTSRQFECTRLIAADQVKQVLGTMPSLTLLHARSEDGP